MKKIIKFIVSIILCLGITYTALWFFMAFQIKERISQFYEIDAPEAGYTFHGNTPELSGFPFKPVITYKKGFQRAGVNIQFDTLKISAIPLPSQPLDILIDTLAIQTNPSARLYEVDKVVAEITIPKSFPATFTTNELTLWQKEIGDIHIQHLELDKNSMRSTSRGLIGLDGNLQPTLNLKTKMVDYDKLIHFMSVETSEINNFQAAIARGVLNSMATTDEATGQKTVIFDIAIKNRKLSLGPVGSIKIPKITWPQE